MKTHQERLEALLSLQLLKMHNIELALNNLSILTADPNEIGYKEYVDGLMNRTSGSKAELVDMLNHLLKARKAEFNDDSTSMEVLLDKFKN